MAKYIHVVLNKPEQRRELGTYAKTVYDGFNGNTLFATPDPSLPTFKGHIDTLQQAEVDATKGLPGAVSARDGARELVNEDLNHLCDYAQKVIESQVSTVDISTIRGRVEALGMRLMKIPPRPKQTYGATPGTASGSVGLTAPTSPARDTHEWEQSTDGKTYTGLPSTRKASTTVTGLPLGVPLYFRHRMVTKDGYTEWSDPPMTITLK